MIPMRPQMPMQQDMMEQAPQEPTVTYSEVEQAFQKIAAKHKNLGIDKIIDSLFGRTDSPEEDKKEMKNG